MSENEDICVTACNSLMDFFENEIKQNDIRLTLINDPAHLNAEFLTETILTMMVRGVYCSRVLPNNDFVNLLETALYSPSCEKVRKIKEAMQVLYSRDLAKYAKANVAALVKRSMKNNTDISGTIREYFIAVSNSTVGEIEKILKGGHFD